MFQWNEISKKNNHQKSHTRIYDLFENTFFGLGSSCSCWNIFVQMFSMFYVLGAVSVFDFGIAFSLRCIPLILDFYLFVKERVEAWASERDGEEDTSKWKRNKGVRTKKIQLMRIEEKKQSKSFNSIHQPRKLLRWTWDTAVKSL